MLNITPDIKFKKELKKLSNSSLNECMQCGTCSIVCSLSPEDKPFPRKEMIWAGWGIKEKLIGNPDIFLCHQCGDCSAHCPRDVKPADVFSAVRQLSYEHYAFPKFFAKLLNKPAFLPMAILIPVVVIASILIFAGTFTIPEGEVNYSKFFPHAWLNSSFSIITLLFYVMAFIGLNKFWKDLQSFRLETNQKLNFIQSFWKAKNDILFHNRFSKCDTNKSRKISHLLVFYGFVVLIIVTLFAIYAALTHNYPLGFFNPFKVLGNVAGIMLLLGLSIMIFNRLTNKEEFGNTNYVDWLFLISLLMLTISGGVVELARFQNWYYAYHLYFVHLVCVWFVIIYLPYSKFGHLLYRTVAMTYAEAVERN
jgi:quinone-modifying oxidoreductase, subunit QmoC